MHEHYENQPDERNVGKKEVLPVSSFSVEMYESLMNTLTGVYFEQISGDNFLSSLAEAKKKQAIEAIKQELGNCLVVCVGGLIRSPLLAKLLTRLGISVLSPGGYQLQELPKTLTASDREIVFRTKKVNTILVVIDPEDEEELAGLYPTLEKFVGFKSQQKVEDFDLRFLLISSVDIADGSDVMRRLAQVYFPEELKLIDQASAPKPW